MYPSARLLSRRAANVVLCARTRTIQPHHHEVAAARQRRRCLSTTSSAPPPPPRLTQKQRPRAAAASAPSNTKNGAQLMLRVGAPFVLFSVLAAWVVSNALEGKLREMEASQGRTGSVSLRQAALSREHDDMMERLTKIVANDDFDNTKRIQRPHEILEERRAARARRNAWHRRAYRSLFGGGSRDAEPNGKS